MKTLNVETCKRVEGGINTTEMWMAASIGAGVLGLVGLSGGLIMGASGAIVGASLGAFGDFVAQEYKQTHGIVVIAK